MSKIFEKNLSNSGFENRGDEGISHSFTILIEIKFFYSCRAISKIDKCFLKIQKLGSLHSFLPCIYIYKVSFFFFFFVRVKGYS